MRMTQHRCRRQPHQHNSKNLPSTRRKHHANGQVTTLLSINIASHTHAGGGREMIYSGTGAASQRLPGKSINIVPRNPYKSTPPGRRSIHHEGARFKIFRAVPRNAFTHKKTENGSAGGKIARGSHSRAIQRAGPNHLFIRFAGSSVPERRIASAAPRTEFLSRATRRVKNEFPLTVVSSPEERRFIWPV